MSKRKRHNPEKQAWKGISYKKTGERIRKLKDETKTEDQDMTTTKTEFELTDEEKLILDNRMREYNEIKTDREKHIKMRSSVDIIMMFENELRTVRQCGFFGDTSASMHPLKGMPCTYHIGSDSYAYMVVDVRRNGMEIDIARIPKAGQVPPELTDAMKKTLTRRKDKKTGEVGYLEKGERCGSVTFFESVDDLDPSF